MKHGRDNLRAGRAAYKEARGMKSDGEATARKAKEAPKVSAEKRKELGHLAGHGEITGKARKVEVHHYHHRSGEKKA